MKKLKLNLKSIENSVEISDGYHTFGELYDHRITLYIVLVNMLHVLDITSGTTDLRSIPMKIPKPMRTWRSKFHSDGTMFDGQFILGIGKVKGNQITYHIPISRWDETNIIPTLDKAPEWDGHTSKDVLDRLKEM